MALLGNKVIFILKIYENGLIANSFGFVNKKHFNNNFHIHHHHLLQDPHYRHIHLASRDLGL